MRPGLIQALQSVNANANQNSNTFNIDQVYCLSAQFISTGAGCTGVGKLQFSNDPPALGDSSGNTPATNWSDITGAFVNISGVGVWDIQKVDVCGKWIRAVFTKNTGSTGTVSVNISTKGV